MINPYYVIRVIFWILVLICLFIPLVVVVYIIEHDSKSLMKILANVIFLGIIILGMTIADNAIMYHITSVERNNSNDEISGPQNITAFINKQIYLYPLYMYIAIFTLILAHFVLYILGASIMNLFEIDMFKAFLKQITGSENFTISSHNFSKIITATIISMCIIVPVHFMSVVSYQVLDGKKQIEQLEHVKNNYKMLKHLTMLLVGVSIFFLLFNIESFHAWSNITRIPYKDQERFELSYKWTSTIPTFALFVLVALVQKLTRTMN